MADQSDEQDYFGGLGQTLLGKPGAFPLSNTGLGATLAQAVSASPAALQDKPAAAPGGYISAAYFKGEDGNPAGHVGVSINGEPYFGRDPAPGIGLIPMIGHEPPGFLQVLSQLIAPALSEVDMIPASRVPADQVRIPASAAQMEQVRQYMLNKAGPGIYDLPVNNCVTFGTGALNAAGLKVPHTPMAVFPAGFVSGLHRLYDAPVPQGQAGH